MGVIAFESLFSVSPAEECCLATHETPRSELQRREENHQIRAILTTLPERQRDILASHFGIDQPQETGVETAIRLGLSKQRISQLKHEALEEIRSRYEEQSNET